MKLFICTLGVRLFDQVEDLLLSSMLCTEAPSDASLALESALLQLRWEPLVPRRAREAESRGPGSWSPWSGICTLPAPLRKDPIPEKPLQMQSELPSLLHFDCNSAFYAASPVLGGLFILG